MVASRFPASTVYSRWMLAAVCLLALAFTPQSAPAVPSFARQTGFPCIACHVPFPQLTQFGREFKARGYTMSTHATKLPPMALMLEGGPSYTHTTKDQNKADLPPDSHANDNVALNQASLFYAGQLLGPYADIMFPASVADVFDHFGVMAQGTWDGVADEFAIDNTEFRGGDAFTFKSHDLDLIYGAWVNNNPGMQDLWNSSPVWGFPFSSSGYAPAPAAAPMLAGGFAQQVVGGGGYAWLETCLYAELGVYGTASADFQRDLGVDPDGENEIDGGAPYWRLAFEYRWGGSSLMVGTFGMDAHTFPQRIKTAGRDHLTDAALDFQYQYTFARHDVTLMGSSIYEHADWNASHPLAITSRSSGDLWDTTITASYLFDKIYGIDFQFFDISGDSDALLFGIRTGSPDSNGIVVQLNYLPFNKSGGPSFWPKSNLKLSLQYTHYNRFDGSSSNFDGDGRDASDNDTLFLEAWWVL